MTGDVQAANASFQAPDGSWNTPGPPGPAMVPRVASTGVL